MPAPKKAMNRPMRTRSWPTSRLPPPPPATLRPIASATRTRRKTMAIIALPPRARRLRPRALPRPPRHRCGRGAALFCLGSAPGEHEERRLGEHEEDQEEEDADPRRPQALRQP